jgi:hypothetical protein
MQYPDTLMPRPDGQRGARIAFDPIAEAWQLIHEAARLPYTTARSRQWGREFRERARAARQGLRRHIAGSMQEDSVLTSVEREQPRLRTAVTRQLGEHRLLALQLDALCDGVAADLDIDIWRMVDLGERAMLLGRALERHHDQLVRLMYEASNRELGGEGG